MSLYPIYQQVSSIQVLLNILTLINNSSSYIKIDYIDLFVFAVLKIEPKALHMVDKCSTTELHPQLLVFWDSVLLCSPDGSPTHNPLTFAS
jgi:hypothetical protein